MWVTRGLYSSMNTMFLSYMIKKTVTSGIHVTLGMSIYSLKMLWRDCTSYNSVWIIILHDNQNSHLVVLYVPWLNDTYNNLTATKKTSLVICNNKGPDQPAHPCSLISNFVVCCLRRIIPRLASCEIISNFYPACLAVRNLEGRFSHVVACVACSTALGQIFQA